MDQLPTLFIGVDVSKDTFTAARKDEKEQWIIKNHPNSEAGIQEFIQHLPKGQAIHIILEATGTYSMKLTFGLCKSGIKCSVLNPKQSKGFIHGVLLSTTKTDSKDACALALYGQCNKPKPFILPSDKMLKAKQLRTLLRQLKKQKRVIENQLHALEYHVQPLDFVLQTLKDSLLLCEQQIQQTQQRICKVTQQAFDKAYQLATTVVGVGPAVANSILISTNALQDFDNYKQLAKYVGVCPTQFESGSSIKGRGSIAKTGDADIRASLFMGARSAKRYNKDCKLLYERLKSKGKCHKVAMLAVCNKMLRQLFAVVKSGVPFDNEYYLKLQNA